jgi:hypothetical protein
MCEEYIKPKSCLVCPAVEHDKKNIICGCLRSIKADKGNAYTQKQMWERCPLKWKEEKKENKNYYGN